MVKGWWSKTYTAGGSYESGINRILIQSVDITSRQRQRQRQRLALSTHALASYSNRAVFASASKKHVISTFRNSSFTR